jgi:diphthine-ammonia ligase
LQNARIILDDSEVILHSADSIASVGILHPLAFHLEYKTESSDRIGNSAAAEENSCCLYEVDEGIAHTDVEENQIFSPVPAVDAYTSTDLCISKTGKNLCSIGCWIQDSTKASQGA